MATRDDKMTQEEQAFASAWGEGEAKGGASGATVKTSGESSGASEPGADDATNGAASGSNPEIKATGNDGDKPNADAAGAGGAADGGADQAGSSAPDTAGQGAGAAPGTGEGDAPGAGAAGAGATGEGEAIDPKDTQREASWRGRLDKRQRELDEREAKLKEAEAKLKKDPEAGAEALEQVADKAEADGDQALANAADKAAEQVEAGKTTFEAAMKSLSENFGDEFMDQLTTVFRQIAREEADLVSDGKVKGLEERTMAGFNSFGERHSALHREKIEEAFPDVDELVGSAEFAAFRDSYPDGAKIAESGTARQVIKMLKAFKGEQGDASKKEEPGTSQAAKDQIDRAASQPAAQVAQAQPDEAALDAAAGVRSNGAARVPDAPAESSTYEGAWAGA